MADTDLPFLKKYLPYALDVQRRYGVPALLALAQHILEGGRENKNKGHNLFGIKPWKGSKNTQVQRTWEVHDSPNVKYPTIYKLEKYAPGGWRYEVDQSFEWYSSEADAYDGYGRFLRAQPRYRPAFAAGLDEVAFARALAGAKYATDPEYAKKLVELMAQLKKKCMAYGFSLTPTGPPPAPALPSPPSLPAST